MKMGFLCKYFVCFEQTFAINKAKKIAEKGVDESVATARKLGRYPSDPFKASAWTHLARKSLLCRLCRTTLPFSLRSTVQFKRKIKTRL